MNIRVFCIAFFLLTAGAAAGPVGAQPKGEETQAAPAVQEAAREWLELIDEQEFEEAWEDAASSFRERIDEADWIQGGTRLVDSLGTASTRTLTTVQRRDSLRRAAGPFIVLTYRSTIAEASFEELLVLVQGDDDWRVAGYRIAPLPMSASSERPSSP